MKPEPILTYIQTTYGEILIGKYDAASNTLHKAITVMMHQAQGGVQAVFVPTGTPLLSHPDSKDFATIELRSTAIAYSVDISKPSSAHLKKLKDNYDSATSSLILNGGGVNVNLSS